MGLEGKEVLIVDDVSDVRMLCKKIVEGFGMTTREAASAAEALEMISQKKPDIIILDLQMPGMSGFDFLTIRKSLPNLADIPILVSSSLKDKVSVFNAIQLGANDYLLKPLNPALIRHRLKKYLRGSDFKIHRFGELERPFLTLQETEDPKVRPTTDKLGAKLMEVDEIGMVILCRTLIAAGSMYMVACESLKEILKKPKPFPVTCLSISMNPAYEAYTAYLEFDPKDATFAENFRDWCK